MKFNIRKSMSNLVVEVTTKVTPEMLDLVPAKTKVLYENEKQVFALSATDSGHASITEVGMEIPATSFFILISDVEELDFYRMKLGQVKKYADKIEKQVLAAYQEIKDAADTIKVTEVEGE